MATVHRAEFEWIGGYSDGEGKLLSTTSGQIPELEMTTVARVDDDVDQTTPEELLAAAYAADFAMQFTSGLVGFGWEPESMEVSCEIASEIGLGITQAIDGIGSNVHSSAGRVICLAADGLVVAFFAAMGYLGRRNRWLFSAGFFAYALDSLICAFFQDWLGLCFHAFALFAMIGAYKGFRQLEHARQASLASTGAPIE